MHTLPGTLVTQAKTCGNLIACVYMRVTCEYLPVSGQLAAFDIWLGISVESEGHDRR